MYLWSHGSAQGLKATVIGRLKRTTLRNEKAGDSILFGTFEEIRAFGDELESSPAILCIGPDSPTLPVTTPLVWAPKHLEYLESGDVVALHPSGMVNVLYRKNSPHNTILLTERCNSYCLMCSQPPKEEDDSYRIDQTLRLLELIDQDTVALGLSGGEPTLLGKHFLEIVAKARDVLPRTALHILTNGRRFAEHGLAQDLAELGHPDLVLGIPLYSDVDSLHDYVVQAAGAFNETINGLYNLATEGVRVEIRVVLHKQTYERLPQLATFIARNLPFVEHVALMGLEMYGFTLANLDVLWIDPVEYQAQLEEATLSLASSGMRVSIYNHQLCTIPRSLWPFAKRSISDWKNVYLEECASCGVRKYCGGFFQSATKRHSSRIKALPSLSAQAAALLLATNGCEQGACDVIETT